MKNERIFGAVVYLRFLVFITETESAMFLVGAELRRGKSRTWLVGTRVSNEQVIHFIYSLFEPTHVEQTPQRSVAFAFGWALPLMR